MNYKTHKGTTDRDTLNNVIADIEYLRKAGLTPWNGASGRRAMESRFTYKETLVIDGKLIDIELNTSASCKYTRFDAFVVIEGEIQKQYLKALKAI